MHCSSTTIRIPARRREALRLVLLLVLTLGAGGLHPAVADPIDPQPPKGFTALFNGGDLTGWWGLEQFDPRALHAMSDADRAAKRKTNEEPFRAHWRVENGELVNDGQGPYADDRQDYGDIELLVEYKTVAKADSGIYLRGNPQVQIWDYTKDGGKWDRGADKGSGGLFNNSPGAPGKDPLVLADKPFGEWNALPHHPGRRASTTVYLNGKLVVDHATHGELLGPQGAAAARAGPIQLQTHGGEIRWRNIFVREIPADEANQILAEHATSRRSRRFSTARISPAGPGRWITTKSWTARSAASRGRAARSTRRRSTATSSSRLEFKLPPGRQQRPGDPLPRRRRYRLRRHVRAAGARRQRPKYAQARPAAGPRLGLRHGRRAARLSAAARRMELPGGHREGLDDQGGAERHARSSTPT